MNRFLMIMLVAIAAVMVPMRAAQAPVSSPDDIEDLKKVLGDDTTDEELLQYLIAVMNEGAQEVQGNNSLFLDERTRTVIMQLDADEVGLPPEKWDEMTPEVTELLKGILMKDFLEDEDIFDLMKLIASTGYGFELQGVFSDNSIPPQKLSFSTNEIVEAVNNHSVKSFKNDLRQSDEDEDIPEVLDGLSEDEVFASLIAMMEESFQAEEDINVHIWIDDNTNAVIMSIVDDSFSELEDMSEMAYMMKPMMLKTLMSSEDGTFVALLSIIAGADRNFELRCSSYEGQTNPFVVRYTPEELNEALEE